MYKPWLTEPAIVQRFFGVRGPIYREYGFLGPPSRNQGAYRSAEGAIDWARTILYFVILAEIPTIGRAARLALPSPTDRSGARPMPNNSSTVLKR
jgi:hypothetical protein